MTFTLLRAVAVTALTSTLAFGSWAGTVSGRITATESQAHGLFLYMDTAPSGAPACGTETVGSRRFVIRITTAEGKAMAANALMAFSANKPVLIFGTNACADWGDTESVQWMRVNQQ